MDKYWDRSKQSCAEYDELRITSLPHTGAALRWCNACFIGWHHTIKKQWEETKHVHPRYDGRPIKTETDQLWVSLFFLLIAQINQKVQQYPWILARAPTNKPAVFYASRCVYSTQPIDRNRTARAPNGSLLKSHQSIPTLVLNEPDGGRVLPAHPRLSTSSKLSSQRSDKERHASVCACVRLWGGGRRNGHWNAWRDEPAPPISVKRTQTINEDLLRLKWRDR